MRRLLPILMFAVASASCGGDEPDASSSTTITTTITITTTFTTPAPADVGSTTDAEQAVTGTTPASVAPVASSVPASATPPTPAADAVPGAELAGRWAHYDVVAYQGADLKTLIVSYGFNDLTVENGRVVDRASFCFSEQVTDQPIETSFSDAATQAIKPPPAPIEVDMVDDILTIRRAATPTPVGIRLDDPANERLPTDPDDPRIVDDDGDGQPGITVDIRVTDDLTGELYIARREIFAYEADLIDADTLAGLVTDDSEQLVIGASDPIFASSGGDWAQFPDLTKSPIILKRVDATWDCDRLAAERPTLFPPTPTIDW